MGRESKLISAALSGVMCFSLLINTSHAEISPEELARIEKAVPEKAAVTPARPRKLLIFNLCKGYRHSSIPYCAKALEIMGKKTGAFEVTQSEDMSVFKSENLAQFDAVCLNNSSQLEFSDPNLRRGLIDFVKGGGGIIGIHAAINNFQDWPEAAEMLGGLFDNHPWGADGIWKVRIEDSGHPVMAAFKDRYLKIINEDEPNRPMLADFKGTTFEINEEIYRIKPVKLRQNCRVLMSLDMTNATNLGASGVRPTDKDVPISWVRSFGKGRVFYCSFGQNHHIFWNPVILQHYLDGIQFALGDLPADTTPLSPSATDTAKAATQR